MDTPTLHIAHQGPVATVRLARPEVHNAFDAHLIADLTAAFAQLGADPRVRVIVLAAEGRSFCAGAQAQYMQQGGSASVGENLADAQRLATLFHTIAQCPRPTVAQVQGAAIGGGVGLVAACDIALGSTAAFFAMAEVRLGLLPATIAPYVVRAIGERQARRFFLTGERFDAATAQQLGLLHAVAAVEELDARVHDITEALLAGAPGAQTESKSLIDAVAHQAITPALREDTAQRIAQRRAHPEAAEGLAAFLAKRSPSWVPIA